MRIKWITLESHVSFSYYCVIYFDFAFCFFAVAKESSFLGNVLIVQSSGGNSIIILGISFFPSLSFILPF